MLCIRCFDKLNYWLFSYVVTCNGGKNPHGKNMDVMWRNVDVTWRNVDVMWRNVDVMWRNVDVMWRNVGVMYK